MNEDVKFKKSLVRAVHSTDKLEGKKNHKEPAEHSGLWFLTKKVNIRE